MRLFTYPNITLTIHIKLLQRVYFTKKLYIQYIVIFGNFKPLHLLPKTYVIRNQGFVTFAYRGPFELYRSGLNSGLAHLSEDWKSPEAGSTSSRRGRPRCWRCSRSRWRPGPASRRPLAARGREGRPPAAGPGGPPEAGPHLQRVEPRTYVRVLVKNCTLWKYFTKGHFAKHSFLRQAVISSSSIHFCILRTILFNKISKGLPNESECGLGS